MDLRRPQWSGGRGRGGDRAGAGDGDRAFGTVPIDLSVIYPVSDEIKRGWMNGKHGKTPGSFKPCPPAHVGFFGGAAWTLCMHPKPEGFG